MPSLWATLTSLLNRQAVSDIASRLGESEHTVTRGLETALASIVTGAANKTSDTGTTRQIYDLARSTPASAMDLSSLAAGPLAAGSSSIVDMGRRLLSTVFGGGQNAITSALARSVGLSEASTSSLMGMAAPLALGALGQRVTSDNLQPSGFANMLQREASEIRGMLPSGVSDVLSRVTGPAARVAHEAAGASRKWLWPVLGACAALVLALLLSRGTRQPRTETMNRPRPGVAERQAPTAPGVAERQAPTAPMAPGTPATTTPMAGNLVTLTLPGNVQLKVPRDGEETRLAIFLQDPASRVDQDTWFDLNRVRFETGSATLRPDSQEELRNVDAILKAYPNARVKIGGYTDNTGNPAQNQRLSQERAETVMAQLQGMGISPDRLEAEGYGDQHPIADNSTAEGRAKNRRISIRVTQK